MRLCDLGVDAQVHLGLQKAVAASLEFKNPATGNWHRCTWVTPLTVHGSTAVLLRAREAVGFPLEYVCDMATGLDRCAAEGHLPAAFDSAFPHCQWSEAEYTQAARVWERVPEAVRDVLIACGRTRDGMWSELVAQI